MDIGRAAFRTSLNLLSNTIFSVDLANPNEDSAKEFRDLVWNIMVEAGKPNVVDYFPELAKIDPQSIRRRMTTHFGKVLHIFGRLIDERVELRRLRNTLGNNDVIDILLNISDEHVNSDDQIIDRTHIERLCLVYNLLWIRTIIYILLQLFIGLLLLREFFNTTTTNLQDLFVAGTDTTSSTLEWAMAEVLRNPETLKKAKAELEQTIGKGKLVEESDIVRLPYVRSIVKETLRIHPPVPFLIPRKVETDVQICGYNVPKGTQVLVNVWAIGRDPSTWSNPTSFIPERFLDSEIDFRGRDFELIPFGAGRRICPGLPLAIRTVPVMLGSLINSFDWKLGGGIAPKDLDMKDKFGITLQKEKPLYAIPLNLSPQD